MGTVAFAQSEKTEKKDNKAKIEQVDNKANKEKDSKSNKDVKAESSETKKANDATKTKTESSEIKIKETKNVSSEKKANETKKGSTETKKGLNESKKGSNDSKKSSTESSEKKANETKQANDIKKADDAQKVKTETAETADNQNGPEISFKETNHDFGEIQYKGNGTYEFVFVNTGNEPLILTQPKSSCGCTVPEWPKQPILPGESNVIRVTYKNTDRPGNFNKYVTVFSNALVNKEVKLHIKGTVLAQPTDAAPLKIETIGTPVNTTKE